MSEENLRSVALDRVESGRYEATNVRGGTLAIGSGDDERFTPVELLLAAIAGCSAIDIDLITGKRAEPSRFTAAVSGEKIRDELGNRLTGITLTFDVEFPEGEAGDAARAVLPRSVQQSHDRLCTVSRTVEVGTPVSTGLA